MRISVVVGFPYLISLSEAHHHDLIVQNFHTPPSTIHRPLPKCTHQHQILTSPAYFRILFFFWRGHSTLTARLYLLESEYTEYLWFTRASALPTTTMDARPMTTPTVLCHNCGAPMDGALGTICGECIRLTQDISQGVPREASLVFCRDCDRWLLPPASW